MSGVTEAMIWLRQQITARRSVAATAATGDGWQEEKHYDALWIIDFRPSDGPVDSEGMVRGASLRIRGCKPFEAPRFVWAHHDQASHIVLNDPPDVMARCEVEMVILDEHYILASGDRNPDYEELCVYRFPSHPHDFGCVACHYMSQGAVRNYGYCRTVLALARAYRRFPGYADHWGDAQ